MAIRALPLAPKPKRNMVVPNNNTSPCKLLCVMADKCAPGECLLAMSQIMPAR